MKNFVKVFSQILTKDQAKAGMTLLETLVAVAGVAAVAGGAMAAMTTIMKNDTEIKANTNIRIETSRALEQIAGQIKPAKEILPGGDLNTTVASMTEEAANAFKTAATNHGFKYGVLVAKVPELENIAPKVYFLGKSPDDANAVYQWAPKQGLDGKDIDASDLNAWEVKLVIDKVSGLPQNVSCEDKWKSSPQSGVEGSISALGFFACINPEGKIAKVSLQEEVANINGTGSEYEKNKQVIAQANDLKSIAGEPMALDTKAINCFLNIQTGDGLLSCNQPAKVKFEVIADDFKCGGAKRAVTAAFKVNDEYVKYVNGSGNTTTEFRANDPVLRNSYELELPADSKVAVRSTLADGCPRVRTTDNPADREFIYGLKNGDLVPAAIMNKKGLDGQIDVAEYLKPYLNDDGKVNIGPDRILFLVEMWTNSDPTAASMDLQDMMVIASYSAINK